MDDTNPYQPPRDIDGGTSSMAWTVAVVLVRGVELFLTGVEIVASLLFVAAILVILLALAVSATSWLLGVNV
jgi:hypothetical protein